LYYVTAVTARGKRQQFETEKMKCRNA
jgi:hypothetical protein